MGCSPLGLASFLAWVSGSLLLWVVLGNFWYCTVLLGRGKCCPFFGFVFFRGSTSAIFRVFVVLLLSGSVFGKLLCNRIFQPYWLANGNLGYRNLLVKQGEMLPLFFRLLLQISFIFLSYIGDGLSWNEFRDNTAQIHKGNFFCSW